MTATPTDPGTPRPARRGRDSALHSLTVRYLVLHGLRWLPSGLLIPIIVLLFTSRGYSLAEYGLLATVIGVTTFLLELPTGGMADALGRRRVLLVAVSFSLVSTVLMTVVAWSTERPSFLLVVIAMVAFGVYRALESGPLDAWYVDAVHAIDPAADVEAGLGRAGAITGVAIAAGSLAAGGVLAWDPIPSIEPMAVVLLASVVLTVAQGVSLLAVMHDPRPPMGTVVVVQALRDVPGVVGSTLSLARSNRVLGLLLVTEATWAIGMVSFENLFPVRLAALAGGSDAAAALLGPASAAAWAASGAGAGAVIHLSRRLGPYRTAALLRLVQGATILAMGLLAGVGGAIGGLVATYLVHGASAPVHYALLHRQVDASRRATVLSLNSMVFFAAISVAAVSVGALADAWTVPGAIAVCAVVTAAGGVFPLLARRHDPAPDDVTVGDDATTEDAPSSATRST
jgi:predicted MFS family arabinose efflux permease